VGSAHEVSLYSDASVYDILHTPGTAGEVDGLARINSLFVKSRRRFLGLEPACGSGRYLRVLAGRGLACVGFDLDAGMVDYARRRIDRMGLGALARVERASMTGFLGDVVGAGRVTFAFNLINTVRHLESDGEMLEHFAQIGASLAKGGVYALGVSTSAYGLEMESEDTWTAVRGRVRVVQNVSYIPQPSESVREERVVSHLTVSTPSGTTHRDSSYALRTYTHAQLHELIAESALTLECVVNEVGEEIDPPLCGYGVYVLKA
jgi:SAM-dependent methyltransferase